MAIKKRKKRTSSSKSIKSKIIYMDVPKSVIKHIEKRIDEIEDKKLEKRIEDLEDELFEE